MQPWRQRTKRHLRRRSLLKASKLSSGAYGSPSSDRPCACPYKRCDKAYIHEYKLKLHSRREHPEYMADENAENTTRNTDHEMDEASDQDNYRRKRANGKSQKQSKQKPNLKMPLAKSAKKNLWPVKEDIYEEEDSEGTEEDQENVEGWRYADNNEDDDEET